MQGKRVGAVAPMKNYSSCSAQPVALFGLTAVSPARAEEILLRRRSQRLAPRGHPDRRARAHAAAGQVQRAPASVAAWLHVENVPAWMAFVGVSMKPDGNSDADLAKALQALTTIDLTRPVDAGLIFINEDDFDGAAAIPIFDKDKFLALLGESFEVTPRKSRYILTTKMKPTDGAAADPSASTEPTDPPKKKKPIDDKTFACEFVASPAEAICGTERGLSKISRRGFDHRRNPTEPTSRSKCMRSRFARLMLAAMKDDKSRDVRSPLTATPEAARKKAESKKKLTENGLAFVNELDRFGLYLTRSTIKSSTTRFNIGFRTTESLWVKPMFASPGDMGAPDLLFTLTENASAALYSPGGGPFLRVARIVRRLELITPQAIARPPRPSKRPCADCS